MISVYNIWWFIIEIAINRGAEPPRNIKRVIHAGQDPAEASKTRRKICFKR
jgi:hypothetical protein